MSDLKVKICGITNLEDACAAVDAGADALGFMFFEQSSRCVPVDVVAEIARNLPPYVLKVGVFVNPNAQFVADAAVACHLDLLQFHGEETPEFCGQFGFTNMKAFRIKDAESIAPIRAYKSDAYLLDSYVAGKHGGTGEKFNWDLAVEAKNFGKPIFLAGGLTPLNIAEAVQKVRPFGVDVSSGVEQAPGRKDHSKIRDFIAAAKGV